ncbi:MAG: [FeFe] hydrogenase H-cluster radical maturase HydG [Anaerophaga sp.]|uniref:[FeFe] hydrogenase H-cluster radical SAM maturase HydG n=1 Tax=Anaerophaga thermohalophila TaxID=177400 RepID=UPI000237CC06|nr:[FeFe] hydrogenase H-cluster radical SAM maturase HydG [Anaerophaga thermohalophila]MBZ4676531.1 [FeFe] hydrogenase H-cluster radical maturase HydG [Anaerophaga sp.]MDI3521452.1 2-iminoacetate synthase [Anaerophaga sp.]MDK2841132.1 2-iminoacetate synthase [Anaerophaga sp.]MDN5289800.1 2-iminoacetate synthase [Anaerophaga sp.]
MSIFYHPQKYRIEDRPMQNFIDSDEIWEILKRNENPDPGRVREVIARSLDKNRLTLDETAVLINANTPELVEEIKQGARDLKERVYGKRIVLFAPLYIGNLCVNNCAYCGFRTSNKKQKRITLTPEEISEEVTMLEDAGHKRLILVFGEHPKYDAKFIADTARHVYSVKHLNGEIRRVNINAAPLDVNGFKIVKEAGIGTYQIFQETYHRDTYLKVHLSGKKRDFDWRITALDRAQEATIDDVGIGALLGLYDWRFEVLGLLRHVNHLEAVYNVGPHTISFPRLKKASGFDAKPEFDVSDEEFTRLVAILRLAVPYTGMILTAREPAHIRDEVFHFGVSQIDGGTNIELKGYSTKNPEQNLDQEQFTIGDNRTLNEVMDELIGHGFLPSFCTACYRLKRTGEHFMEFSVPGFIKRFCQPNAILTMAEYLEDYAPQETKEKGYRLIEENLKDYKDEQFRDKLIDRLERVKKGERDLYF